MKTYYIELHKDGQTLEVSAAPANNLEEAISAAVRAAIGRGRDNFSARETTEDAFQAFMNGGAPTPAAQPEEPPAAPESETMDEGEKLPEEPAPAADEAPQETTEEPPAAA
jgi:hypothetical protein